MSGAYTVGNYVPKAAVEVSCMAQGLFFRRHPMEDTLALETIKPPGRAIPSLVQVNHINLSISSAINDLTFISQHHVQTVILVLKNVQILRK